MVALSLIRRALIMATPGGHSRLNSGSTVVLACGVSMPTSPRGAYSSDMSFPACPAFPVTIPDDGQRPAPGSCSCFIYRSLRGSAGLLDHLAEADRFARHQRGKLLRRARNDVGHLRQHLLLDLVALQRLDELRVELADDGGRRAG